ncbi:hypothetical protein ACF0H5_011965 [Mactra antiquata]
MDVKLHRVKRLDAWVNHIETKDLPVDVDWYLPVAAGILATLIVVFVLVYCIKRCRNNRLTPRDVTRHQCSNDFIIYDGKALLEKNACNV